MIYTLKTNDNFLEIGYQPKHRFVSCIQKKTVSSFPFVLTNRIAMAETSLLQTSIVVLWRGEEEGGYESFLHPMGTTQIHTWVAVCMLYVSYVIWLNQGVAILLSRYCPIVFGSCLWICPERHDKVKIWNPYYRRKVGNKFYLSQKKEDLKGDCPLRLEELVICSVWPQTVLLQLMSGAPKEVYPDQQKP